MKDLLDLTRLPTVDQMIMIVKSIIKEVWLFLLVRGESYIRDVLEAKECQSQMITRSRTENKLDVAFPVDSFIYYGQKLWNKLPGDLKRKMSKNKFKMKVKRLINEKS